MFIGKLREGVIVFSIALVVCAAVAGYWFPVSLPGILTGVLYGALSAEAYGAMVRCLASDEHKVGRAVVPLVIKLNLLAAFVYILAVSSTVFMYSALCGLLVVVPAGIWASLRHQ